MSGFASLYHKLINNSKNIRKIDEQKSKIFLIITVFIHIIKKMKKTAKIGLIVLLSLGFLLFVSGMIFLLSSYFSSDRVRFDEQKLVQASLKIEFFDSENRPIKEENSFNNKYIKLSQIPNHVKDAFISIEDKDFYNHKGLNYKRMVKALLHDIKNRNFSQGASTISQQLIKNTHLSSQKTISRKINEIVLSKKLENTFSKDEILESYLNVIYFGDNCYGIESASNHYFSKSTKQLNLNQACILAGMISSPARYSPLNKPENCIKRRNLVLKEMLEDQKISQEEYENAKNKDLEINVLSDKNNKLNSYTESALDEAIQILNMPAKQISNGGYKIYTFLNKEKQENLVKTSKEIDFEGNNYSLISLNSKNSHVEAYIGNSDYKILKTKRQPGSAIKPVLVYAPAINEGIINPQTQILDEHLSISGYTPKNHDNNFHGYISVEEALVNSYNIPAVKIMSYNTLETSKYYAEKCGIEFDELDNNYALALGGMTYGTDLLSLCGAYSIFSNDGVYTKPKFVKYITDSKDRIVYLAKDKQTNVIRDDTAYLTNQMLISASKKGTSKRLSDLDFQVASKTGTVGKNNNNYDAWSISYTTDDIVGVWIGNMDNKPIGNIVGGTTPILTTKSYMSKIYKNKMPNNFSKPASIETIDIDTRELTENHQVVKAGNYLPERYRLACEFSRFYPPKSKEISYHNLKPASLNGKVDGLNAVLTFEAKDFLTYELYCNDKLIKTFENVQGNQVFLQKLPYNKKTRFYLVTKIKNYTTGECLNENSNEIVLINSNSQSNKWYL